MEATEIGILNIIREIRRENLIAPSDRGLIQRLKRRITRNKTYLDRPLSIFLNTYCNLNCFSCAALGMDTKPPEANTRIEDIELFLVHMEKLHPGGMVMLTGGEPTMYPDLEKICGLVRQHGFKVSMLTNGYKFYDPELFDLVLLDYHSVNKDKIEEWKAALNKSDIAWDIRMKEYHQDIPFAIKDNKTMGIRCSNWLKPLTLWQNVVYPCCNIMCVEWWHDTFEVSNSLIENGWIVENPNLVATIKNWRETLPSQFYRLCAIGCWKDADKARWKPIQDSIPTRAADFCEKGEQE